MNVNRLYTLVRVFVKKIKKQEFKIYTDSDIDKSWLI